jgi:hypothetical protein
MAVCAYILPYQPSQLHQPNQSSHKMYKIIFLLAFAQIALAQHPYSTTVPLKVYAEPSAHTLIRTIAKPTDSIGVIRQTEQDGQAFWCVQVWLRTLDKDGKVINSLVDNFVNKPIKGFVAVEDLDKTSPATQDISKKINQSAFANMAFLLEYDDIDKQIKVVTIEGLSAQKKVLTTQTRFADDFFAKNAQILAILPTDLRRFQIENDYYLRCRNPKNWKPNPDNIYTIKVALHKRNLYNWLFKPSRILSIDSVSERARFAAIQAVRVRDSCIVWHADRSNIPYPWTGGCKNGYADGLGTLYLDSNRVYKGRLVMGMLHGEGTLRDNAWEIHGAWQQGELMPDPTVNTVLYYKNLPPARDTGTYKMYPTIAPLTKWYANRSKNLTAANWKYGTKGFRKNDVLYPYTASYFQLILPDNENPAYKTYKNNECVSFTTWKYKGYDKVGILYGDAPFIDVWCSQKHNRSERDAHLYYWARDNKWYWWGLTHSGGPYPTFADAVRVVCGCAH